jgi:thioredoxin 1
MPGEILHFTKRNEVVEYLQQNKFVIIKFTATWCGPCKRSSPLVMKLFNQLPDNVSMIIVDIDAGRDIASAIKIKSVPTMYNYIYGAPMDSIIGSNSGDITSFFKKTFLMASA